MGLKIFDPYAQTNVRDLYKELANVISPMGRGLTPYSQQVVPGPSPLQQQAFGLYGGLGSMFGPAQDITMQALERFSPQAGQRAEQLGMQGLEQMMMPFDPTRITQAFEPIRQMGMQTYKQDMLPWLAEKYGPALGAKESGAFGRELSRGLQNLSLGLTAQAAPYQMQGFENWMNRQGQAIPYAQQQAMLPGNILNQTLGGVGQYPFQLGQGLMGMGETQRGITSEMMGEPYMKWQYPFSPGYLQALQIGLGEPGFEGFYKGGSQGFGSSLMAGLAPTLGAAGGGALAGALLPGVSAGTGAALALLSDERLKQNIEPIENCLDKVEKLNGKTFNYIGNSERNAGLIAQDVEKVLPEGIIEKDGIKYIKYEAIIGLLVNAIKELKVKTA